jgi:hypothetical protein
MRNGGSHSRAMASALAGLAVLGLMLASVPAVQAGQDLQASRGQDSSERPRGDDSERPRGQDRRA